MTKFLLCANSGNRDVHVLTKQVVKERQTEREKRPTAKDSVEETKTFARHQVLNLGPLPL